MKKIIHMLRRSQSLSPFGVGAIVDQQGESFVPADVTLWKEHGVIIHEQRLETYLGVKAFRMAPAAPDNFWEADDGHPGVPCVRFPFWHFCPVCRKMSRHPFAQEAPVCDHCRMHPTLVPIRFVMACPRGHLEDIPWARWAHSGKRENRCRGEKLEFRTMKGGGGLEFLSVHCLDCGASNTLAGIANPDSMKHIAAHCSGTQPWQKSGEGKSCDAVPQVLQRGATNLTFARIESAIEIPPWSSKDAYTDDTTRITSDELFPMLRTAYEAKNMEFFEQALEIFAGQINMPVDVVRKIVLLELTGGFPTGETNGPPEDREEGLLDEEFKALTNPIENYNQGERFIKRTVHLEEMATGEVNAHTQAMKMCLDRMGMLVQVTRLREVRALVGFSRLSPVESLQQDPDEDPPGRFSLYGSPERISPKLVAADLGKLRPTARWLPAIEVYGEGIFFTLNESLLAHWEKNPEIIQRAKILEERREENATYLPVATPRFLLLHTLAHILIRQLGFDCGYSIASLRERLYVRTPAEGEPMAGILIYTAAGDAEGTLGGLVRQGKADRMMTTLLKSIQSAAWCSSDPLCRESQGQGLHALNLAACHACSLLPETSCIYSNRLLDRVMLIGSPDGRIPGFITPLLDHIMNTMKPD